MSHEFRIREWDRFQHYKKRDDAGRPSRRPTWIKVYTRLLDDPAYLSLTPPQRALLHGLWMWWASMDLGERWTGLRLDILNNVLALNAKMGSYEALNHAGFIEIRASTATGVVRFPARAEEKREEKRQEDQPLPTTTSTVTDENEQPDELAERRASKQPRIEIGGKPGAGVIADFLEELTERARAAGESQ